MKNVTFLKIIVTIISIIVISGCYTKKRAIEKFCKQDSVLVKIHDTIFVSLPQDTGKFSLAIDSLKSKIALLESDSGLPEPPARTMYEDSLILVTAKLNKKTKELEWQLTHKKPIIKEIPIYVEVKAPCNCPEDTIGFWDNWQYFVFGALAGIILFALVIIIRK